MRQLRYSLQGLSIGAAEQIRVIGGRACTTCELLTDFGTWSRVFLVGEPTQLTTGQRAALEEIAEAIGDLSPRAVECWSPDALVCPTWEPVRRAAAKALGSFGWPVQAPPAFLEVQPGQWSRE